MKPERILPNGIGKRWSGESRARMQPTSLQLEFHPNKNSVSKTRRPCQQLPQPIRQNPAVQVVINLDSRVKAPPSSSRSDGMTLGRPFKAGTSQNENPSVASATPESAPQVTFIVFDAVLVEEFHVFLLERLLMMMFALTLNVANHIGQV